MISDISRTVGLDLSEVFDRLERIPPPEGEFGVDPFGLDPDYIRYVAIPAYVIYKYYFRVRVTGAENIPVGRCLIVANHSGQLPFDGVMIGAAFLMHAEPPRILRSMVDRFVYKMPFLSTWFPRIGQIVGTPENARALLEQGEPLQVFPEGVSGLNKTWKYRYQLQQFGLGFMRLAIETDTPVVPATVVGAEEQAPSLYNFKALGKILGMPAFPITPTNPWLPVVGLIPYPSRYHIHFGEPISFKGNPNDEDDVMGEKVKIVSNTMQTTIETQLKERTSVFW